MSNISLCSNGSQYSNEDRREAAAHYVVHGVMSKVSKLTNISETTLSGWKKNDWWVELTEGIRREKSDQIDSSITRILEASTAQLEDRIVNGDEIVGKDGEKLRLAMKGRDLATVFGITFDKRQIIRNLPTSIKAESTDSRLNQLAEKVRELQAGGNKVISGESEVVNNNDLSDIESD